jgi:hypothetical protein
MRISKREAETVVFGLSMAFVLLSASAAVAQAVGKDDSQSNVVAVADTSTTTSTTEKKNVVIPDRVDRGVKIYSLKAASVTTQPPAPSVLAKYAERRAPLEPLELKELLTAVGFEGEALKLAWGIVMRESRGGPTSHNGNSDTGDNSYGLFQINMIGGLGTDRREKYGLTTNEELFNPVANARIAFLMSGGGKDFGAWGVGKNAYNGGKVGDLYSWVAKFPSK